jgi:hypothetical protein
MRVGKRVAPKHRDPTGQRDRLPNWQAALLGLYAFLFALVFPFLCWGQLAQPDHPHRFPHFVFASPVVEQAGLALAAAVLTPALACANAHKHDVHTHVHGTAQLPSPEAASTLSPPLPVGRAAPTLLIFFLLLFIPLGLRSVKPVDRCYSVLCYTQPFPASTTLDTPHPPPRAVSSSPAFR